METPIQTPTPPSGDFSSLGLLPQLVETLTRNKFTTPTPIQAQAIPIAVTGKDIIGIAQTGTGKTLAFGLPLLQRVMQNKGRSLVVLPTRELALQVEEALANFGRSLGLRTAVIIGGAAMFRQTRDLQNNPHIVIGTPGRIIDHLEQRNLNLSGMTALVLDEADRMLDLGFAPQIRRILETMPKERQTMLFSATMPADIVRIAQQYMQLPLRVEVAPAGTTAARVTQELFLVAKEKKQQLLEKLLAEHEGSTLVFTRTKHGAKKLTRAIKAMDHKSVEIHGNRTLAQRKDALNGFKDGRYRVLVATDIAARGIDVTGIQLVVNYDVPENPEDYVHRIGRTGRAGLTGHAITFVQPDQRNKLRDIERLVRAQLMLKPLPDNLPAVRFVAPAPPELELHRRPFQQRAPRQWQRAPRSYQNNDRQPQRSSYAQPANQPAQAQPAQSSQQQPARRNDDGNFSFGREYGNPKPRVGRR